MEIENLNHYVVFDKLSQIKQNHQLRFPFNIEIYFSANKTAVRLN